jgi:hypothetical protein
MVDSKQFEAFDGLERIKASEFGYKIGFFHPDFITVVKKNHFKNDFIIYITKKEYFENKGDWDRVNLWFALIEDGTIIFQEESKSVWLSDEISNLLRIN